MDISQTLKDTENALRDFISIVLRNKFGDNWLEECGVTRGRLVIWKERKKVESKKQKFGTVENRLLYYADFYDLKTILKKHWGIFQIALGEWKIIEVYLLEIEKLRNPDAHRRELLPHQKQLASGILGEIRSRIVRYRSKLETTEDYFPRIESVRDNFGNIWTPESIDLTIYTDIILRPDDILEFVITASDPLEGKLKYAISHNIGSGIMKWGKSNSLEYTVKKKDINRIFSLFISILSSRNYHAVGDYCDDFVQFSYTVLPQKNE